LILPGIPSAQPYTISQAKALACVAIDLFWKPHLTVNMKSELEEDLKNEMQ